MTKISMKNCIEDIYNAILSKGVISSTGDIMTDDPFEDRVYVKRININKDYTFKNTTDTVELVCISINSDYKDFYDVIPIRIRVNMKNRNNQWVNIFIHEAPVELVKYIHNEVC